MNPNRFIQLWRQLMARIQRDTDRKPPSCDISIELVPVLEEPALFQARKEEVQVLLTDIFLRLHRRGRPKKNDQEEAHAA
jgi:hypothetical protein